VGTALLLIVAVLLPTVAGCAVLAAVRGRRALAARRATPVPRAALTRLGSDLRRLHAQFNAVELSPGLPAKAVRRSAVRAAYLDVLTAACRAVDVRPPEPGADHAVPRAEIYRVEDALRRKGLDVRAAPAR
jgi:hypothetical protein